MTYESRLTANYAFGTLTSAAAISDTTLTSADFANYLPSGLSTTIYVPMTLQDPTTHLYEIVWVNAHTAAATTCTVVRGKESTSARAWGSGTLWTVAPTLRDGVLPVTTRSALPADPHVGMRAYIQDEQVSVTWVLNVGWLSQSGMAYRASQVLGADTPSITFSSIPSTLKKLTIAWVARGTAAFLSQSLLIRINGDSTSSYFGNYETQQQTTMSYATETPTFATVGGMPAATATVAADWAAGEINIIGWNQPGSRAAVNWHWTSNFWDTTANSFVLRGAGSYTGAGPYTSITLLPQSANLKAGSEATIYGWG